MTVWFTSDTHFGHTNVIKYSGRPFLVDGAPNAEFMDRRLVELWNERVSDDDDVYHLGDVSFRPRAVTTDIVKSLKGRKHLVLGNHDCRTKTAYRSIGFDTVEEDVTIELGGVRLRLRHQVVEEDVRSDDGVILCGHVHELWSEKEISTKRVINVGVDVRMFRPVTFDELEMKNDIL